MWVSSHRSTILAADSGGDLDGVQYWMNSQRLGALGSLHWAMWLCESGGVAHDDGGAVGGIAKRNLRHPVGGVGRPQLAVRWEVDVVGDDRGSAEA